MCAKLECTKGWQTGQGGSGGSTEEMERSLAEEMAFELGLKERVLFIMIINNTTFAEDRGAMPYTKQINLFII